MRSTAIDEVLGWEALDSRGRPTVAARVTLAGGAQGRAIVPSGASTGSYEARELRDGAERHHGGGVETAVANVNGVIATSIRGLDSAMQTDLDEHLVALDGTASLERLGANAILAVSLAVALAHANALQQPVYRAFATGDPLLPLPMVNIVSGGAHAGRSIDVQDVLVIPLAAHSFREAIDIAAHVRRAARDLVAEGGSRSSFLVADEGGLAMQSTDGNEAAIELVWQAIRRAGLIPGTDAVLALDVAANQLADENGNIRLASENRTVTHDDWLAQLAQWQQDYDIASFEDIYSEDDWQLWQAATATLGAKTQIIGDDLFATNIERVHHGIQQSAANSVLIKPNQAGTLSRARAVLDCAQRANLRTVVSARSGDTEDSWLADFAVGWRAGQIKVGSTTRSERTAKWNRLLEIEAELGRSAQYAGAAALGASMHADSPYVAGPNMQVSAPTSR